MLALKGNKDPRNTRKEKHLVLTRLFEFGGSNSHLKALLTFLGRENVVLVLTDDAEMQWLPKLGDLQGAIIEVLPGLLEYADLNTSTLRNFKKLVKVTASLISLRKIVKRYHCTTINICSTEPEKYIYVLWLPFIRVFYTLHSTAGAKRSGFTSFTCSMMLNKNRQIITVSGANKAFICRNWDIDLKLQDWVQVVPNCVNPDDSAVEQTNYPNKPAEKSICKIVTLGHVIDYKNPLVWFEVASLVTAQQKEVVFEWFGTGPLFDEMLEKTKNSANISFKGVIDHPGTQLSDACIYYQPSIFETQGIAVIEAMSNQLPCVVSNTGGLKESIEHEVSGFLVDPYDKQAQVTAIIKLVNSAQLRKNYGQNAYRKYLECFTYPVFQYKMNLIYGA